MSLAATQDYQPQETLMVPEGGIASFLNATEGDWATDEIPRSGIAQVKHVADRLAEYGRNEDEFMVHAAEGETVVPLEVLNANPQLKFNLFKQMEAMGLEPERYVVGNELNSLNPITGQPEFFLKKLFKGVKKLVKKVVKVIKKAVPIILPIALAMTPLGPIFGAAMGSGINTLAAGGSFKDALKAGVKAGAIGGFASGIAGGVGSLRAGNTFAEGFKSSVGSAAGGVGERFRQFASPGRVSEAGGSYFGDPTRAITSPEQAQATQAGIANTQAMQKQLTSDINARINPQVINETRLANQQILPGQQGRGVVTVGPVPAGAPVRNAATYNPNQFMNTTETGSTLSGASDDLLGVGQGSLYDTYTLPSSFTPSTVDATTLGTSGSSGIAQNLERNLADSSKFDRARDYLVRGGQTPFEVENARRAAGEAYLASTPADVQSAAMFEAKRAAAGPGRLARFGPSALLASGIASGTGFFEPPETEGTETELLPTGADLLAANPEKYTVRYPAFTTDYGLANLTAPGYGAVPNYGGGYASGGDVDTSEFPRQNGAIAGPGTGTSDDVPAMLSDGEFVMTARAVRGAGNGDRNNGMQTMYNLMRNFEAAR